MGHAYRIEAGDVLLSLQAALAGEEQRRPGRATGPPGRPGAVPAAVVPISKARRPPTMREAMALHPSARRLGDPPPPTDLGLVDPGTGAGSLRALRRDLLNEMTYGPAARPGPSVIAIRVERHGDDLDGPPPETLMRAVVEVVPFMVRPRDRVYRSGPNELALLMPATDDEGAEVALSRLLHRVPRVLAARRLGQVRLMPRRVRTDGLGAKAGGSG